MKSKQAKDKFTLGESASFTEVMQNIKAKKRNEKNRKNKQRRRERKREWKASHENRQIIFGVLKLPENARRIYSEI